MASTRYSVEKRRRPEDWSKMGKSLEIPILCIVFSLYFPFFSYVLDIWVFFFCSWSIRSQVLGSKNSKLLSTWKKGHFESQKSAFLCLSIWTLEKRGGWLFGESGVRVLAKKNNQINAVLPDYLSDKMALRDVPMQNEVGWESYFQFRARIWGGKEKIFTEGNRIRTKHLTWPVLPPLFCATSPLSYHQQIEFLQPSRSTFRVLEP